MGKVNSNTQHEIRNAVVNIQAERMIILKSMKKILRAVKEIEFQLKRIEDALK